MCSALRFAARLARRYLPARRKFRHHHRQSGQARRAAPQLLAPAPRRRHPAGSNRDLILSNFATTSGTNSQSEEALQRHRDGSGRLTTRRTTTPPICRRRPSTTGLPARLRLFLSPDGKAARMIITYQGVPARLRASRIIDERRDSAFDAPKATLLSDAKIYVAGTRRQLQGTFRTARSTTHHRRTGGPGADPAHHDVHFTQSGRGGGDRRNGRAVARALFDCRSWCGSTFSASSCTGSSWRWPSSCCWQGRRLQPAADPASRRRSTPAAHRHHPCDGRHPRVVTAAGLVFAATMSSFIFSDLVVLGQIGTTIGLGLLFDTLTVRSFMTPSIAAMLGRWFWWPLNAAPGQPNAAALRVRSAVRAAAPRTPPTPDLFCNLCEEVQECTSPDRRADREC